MTIHGSKFSTQIPGVSAETLDYQALFLRVQAGHSLVTANSRLTRVLTDKYNQWRIHKGDRQWQSPDICSWKQWLDKWWVNAGLLQAAGTDLAVPNSRQLVNLWENTLKNEPLAQTLLRPESLASQLRDTRQLITEWLVDLNDPAWFGHESENHAAFQQWNQAFDRLCKQGNWINPDNRIVVLSDAFMNQNALVPSRLDLIGFDEYSPAQSRLLNVLTDKLVPVCHLNIEPCRSKAVMWKSTDSKNELQQMARWVRHWFEKEPEASIAVVVHDLQARRQEIERVLTDILTPADQNHLQQARPWNISMGTPLVKIPMIEAAFDLLKMLDPRIDIQDIGRVLRSPWLRGSETERNSRALLEKCLREKYPRQLKLGEFLYRSDEVKTHDRYNKELPESEHSLQPWHSPLLNAALRSLSLFDKKNKKQRPASAWAELFDQLLMGLGWAQEDPDAEYSDEEHGQNWQALQAWRECLRELASLDATSVVLGRAAAINQLRQICREKIFQAHSPHSNIQILGLYEISGLKFDHLWVLGLHNDNWPGSAKPNPFIPGKLQHLANLPNSSPQRELKVAHTVTRRLLRTAPDCVFSFPGQLDGEDLLPSPLLDNDEIVKVESTVAWKDPDWCNTVARAEEPFIDIIEAPGRLLHKTPRGGSSILRNQALCPFRAFATNRLGAESMETPVDGISAKLHGSLVHTVLELFWKETKSQSALLQLDELALAERVQKHVTEVTNEERGLKQRPAFLDVEAKRVYRHVLQYLELEKQRDAFEVTGFEKEILPEIEGQVVRLVIDRVDRLSTGEEIIIDYKTGKVDPKKWFGNRPEDPQLPLYAISADETPAAVAFGIIKDDVCEFKGIVSRHGLLPGLPPKAGAYTNEQIEAGQDMAVTIENWRQTIHRLMAEFLAGEAAIEPKNDKICENTYCELHSLCRVNELRQRREVHHESTGVTDGQEVSS